MRIIVSEGFLILDAHGSVIDLADDSESAGSSGVVVNYEYDAWGNLLNTPHTVPTGNGECLADDSESTQSTGVVVNYEYDAWGNLLNIPQTVLTGNGDSLADANPFRYCGYQFDKETGFYYLKYRYYVPSLGRFLTRDPMMTGNRYVYCRNNPVNFVDPLGLDETRPIIYYYARTVYVPKKTSAITPGGENRPTVYYHARTIYPADNSGYYRGFIENSIEGIAETSFGKYVIEKIRDTQYLFKINPQTGLPTLAGSKAKFGVGFFKGFSKYVAGPLSASLYLGDIGSDIVKYEGSEQWGAMGITTKGFISTIIVGAFMTIANFPGWIIIGAGALYATYVGTEVENEKFIKYGID